jgi:selenide,water dikinase
LGCVPGGTSRNFASYGHKLTVLDDYQRSIGCDPQTSGGLLVAVKPEAVAQLESILHAAGIQPYCIGRLLPRTDGPWVSLR